MLEAPLNICASCNPCLEAHLCIFLMKAHLESFAHPDVDDLLRRGQNKIERLIQWAEESQRNDNNEILGEYLDTPAHGKARARAANP
jgi:hypothetical protein